MRAASTSLVCVSLRRVARADKVVRDKAVLALERYLRSAHDMTELEMRKIWKALFYCFWHSDKPKVQADLAERLAALVHVMPQGQAWPFVRVFWSTMCREWTLIDRLRLDKFYMLMRRSLAHSVKRVAQAQWSTTEVAAFTSVLGGESGPVVAQAPTGVRYFMCDSFLPAVQQAIGSAGGGAESADALLADESLLALLEPFVLLLGAAADDAMLKRLVDGIVQPLLANDEGEEGEEGDESGKPALPRPLEAMAERLFTLASHRSTLERNRKLIYTLQQRVEGLAAAEAAAAAETAATAAVKPTKGRKRAVADKAPAPAGKKKAKRVEAPAAAASAASDEQLSAIRSMLAKPKPAKRADGDAKPKAKAKAGGKQRPRAE